MAAQSLSLSFNSRQSDSDSLTPWAGRESAEQRSSRRSAAGEDRRRRAAVYSRRRTSLSEVEACLDRLKARASSRAWQFHFEYADLVRPKKELLPVLDGLQSDAEQGCFDALLVERLSDLVQNPQDLGHLISRLVRAGVVFVSHEDGIDTSRVDADALIATVEATERMSRELSAEKSGTAIAKARREGRMGRPRIPLDVERLRGETNESTADGAIAQDFQEHYRSCASEDKGATSVMYTRPWRLRPRASSTLGCIWNVRCLVSRSRLST